MFPTLPLRTALLTLLALGATAALAHAELESSTPEDGETVNTALPQVELVFSESVELGVSTFKVYPLPDDLAAAEATAARTEGLEPVDDSDDDTLEVPDSDDGDDSDDSATGDDMSDDDGDDDASHDDAGDDDSHDDSSHDDAHGLDSSSDLAAFVESVVTTEGDEAQRVDTGVSSQGSEISLDLTPDLAAGWYVAMWHALSSDGHPVEGFVTFNYEP